MLNVFMCVVMPSGVMLSAVWLGVVRLSVVRPDVVAPSTILDIFNGMQWDCVDRQMDGQTEG